MDKIIFREHIPSSFDLGRDYKAYEVSVNNTNELIDLDLFKRWASNELFSHFVKSGNLIMAILDDGYSWYVIGFVSNPDIVDLPIWSGSKYQIEVDGNVFSVDGDQVSWSTGSGEGELKDGTKFKRVERRK